MKIETNRLILRYFDIDDAKDISRICNNYNIYKTTINLPFPYTYEDAVSWIEFLKENITRIPTFAIVEKNTDTLIGCVGCEISQVHNRGEVGYWLDEEYWNKGYMTEALLHFINYLFKERKIHKVHAEHFKDNIASGQVMEKVGMTYEGTFKDHYLKNGEYKDIEIKSLINIWEDK